MASTKTITQKILFKSTTPSVLYELYMDAKRHSLLTGGKAVISKREGAKFSVYGKYATGKNLQLIRNRLIVQSWRASDWKKTDVDSTLTILFEAQGSDVLVTMTHANVPEEQAKSLANGWNIYYWKPWKNFLKVVM